MSNICALQQAATHCHLTGTGDEKDAGGDIVEIGTEVKEVWLLSGSKEVLYEEPDPDIAFAGDLSKSYAHW